MVAALAEGHILSESVARRICQWTDKLPEDCRLAADAILIVAAKSGADLRGLAELAAEIYARSLPDPDDSPDDGFDERSVRLETTFEGAGVLTGDLTPECAAVVTAVLDALSAPAGAEDTRTYGQRYHDALQEAMRRLVASDLLPERAGQPVKVVAHIALADLLLMDGSSALQEEWIASARAAWAAARAGASVGGSDGAAWLDSAAAQAVACDASASAGIRRVWELAEPDLPPQIEPFSFVSVGLLRHVAHALSLSPGTAPRWRPDHDRRPEY